MVTNTPILHTGAGEDPEQGTRDITAFVKEKQIARKTFLRGVRPNPNPPFHPPLRLPLPASKLSTRPDMGVRITAIASPFILHKMPISLPTLLALMWGGAGTPSSVLLSMAMGELKA
ncbi:hypothetical protein K443DRAFT_318749 [Laccaria amethystina LaAM-08-1]|uniref:Uncharacterized protein n=1 Tax=Laccaria amethystina LaAM-08-1 TaxID=1095629 RepID=A0A0C9Y6Z8_9AGAR|nr:hypothetical protein K443DRAFT_318749 [Laccaria amethystina LaAM-08-1]